MDCRVKPAIADDSHQRKGWTSIGEVSFEEELNEETPLSNPGAVRRV
jgi:hypothetical protein